MHGAWWDARSLAYAPLQYGVQAGAIGHARIWVSGRFDRYREGRNQCRLAPVVQGDRTCKGEEGGCARHSVRFGPPGLCTASAHLCPTRPNGAHPGGRHLPGKTRPRNLPRGDCWPGFVTSNVRGGGPETPIALPTSPDGDCANGTSPGGRQRRTTRSGMKRQR